jgi:hypothetical protein
LNDHEKIREILDSTEFSESDKAVVMWQYQLLGGFYTALWSAIARADEDNLERLSHGFPIEVEGYRSWSYGNLSARLRSAGLDI